MDKHSRKIVGWNLGARRDAALTAHMESFFHSMKCEQLYGKKFDTEHQLRSTLSSYIRFYNERRLHSSLQYLPPAAYESRVYGEPSVN